ncbi:hypothetical protein Q8F55_008210 [Vanrija albida]|uniref:Uncharacterized protein n=1 Tax=Vanrija albida TaxID=181172 RepID=A0ABR3PVL5_9TREE
MPLPIPSPNALLSRLGVDRRPSQADVTPFEDEPPYRVTSGSSVNGDGDDDMPGTTVVVGSVSSHREAARELSSLNSSSEPSYRLDVVRAYARAKLSRSRHPSEVAGKLESLEWAFPQYDHTFRVVREEFGLDKFDGASSGQGTRASDSNDGPINSMESLLEHLGTPAAQDPEIAHEYIRSYLGTKQVREMPRARLIDRLNRIAETERHNSPSRVRVIRAEVMKMPERRIVPVKEDTISTTVGSIHSREYLLSRLDARHLQSSGTWAHDCIRSYIMNKVKRGVSVTQIDDKLKMIEQLRRQYAKEFIDCRTEFGLPRSTVLTEADLRAAAVTSLPPTYGSPLPSGHAAAGANAQYHGAAGIPQHAYNPYGYMTAPYPIAQPAVYPVAYPGYVPAAAGLPPAPGAPPVPPPPQRAPYIAPAVTRAQDEAAAQAGEALPPYTLQDAERETAVRDEQATARRAEAAAAAAAPPPVDTTADLLARLELAEAARRDLEARLAAIEAATGANVGSSSTGAASSAGASSSAGPSTSPAVPDTDSKPQLALDIATAPTFKPGWPESSPSAASTSGARQLPSPPA